MNKQNMDNNFIYRWAEVKDIDACAKTMQDAFRGYPEFGEWVRMMMDGRHASARPDTVAVAEDKITGKIVAVITTCPQTWYYEGIPLKTLNITEVGTRPDYQGKGLAHSLINTIHQTLETEEYDFSFVWGVPWFYKQFGYYQTLGNKMCKSYSRYGILAKWGESNPYTIRPMRMDDIPFAVELHLQSSKNNLVSFPYDARYWQMFVFDYFEQNRDQYRVIEKNSEMLGVFVHGTNCEGSMGTYMIDLIDKISWLDVIPWVTGYLIDYGDKLLEKEERRVEEVTFSLREGHPVFEILNGCFSRQYPAEQNYYRIVDIGKLLLKISTVLEKRIADSFICGYTRDVTIQLFGIKKVLKIVFRKGNIAEVSWVDNINGDYCDVHMPLEYFMQILFGQRDIEDFIYFSREVGSWNSGQGVDNELRILFKILFPKKPSHINHCL